MFKSKIDSLLHPFLDPIGRVSDKPKDQEYGITDNPLLFTGEAALLLALSNQIGKNEVGRLDEILTECEIYPGLYRRQPAYYQDQYKIPMNAVSHDEYNGVCFMVAACPEFFRSYALDIVNYGEKFDWQFNDIAPYGSFFPQLFDAPFQTIKELRLYLKDKKENPQDTNSVDLRHPPYIISLGQWRQPRDRAFYKIAAGLEPSMFEVINLAAATVFSSLGDPFKSRGGTKLMSWFRMLAIERLDYESRLLKLAHKVFRLNLKKALGEEYPTRLALNYFDRLSANETRHPLIDMIDKHVKACIASKKPV